MIGQPHQVLHPIGVTLDRVLGGLGERPQLLTVLPFEAGSDTSITPLTFKTADSRNQWLIRFRFETRYSTDRIVNA
ncbi:hypothetical protein BB347_15355 [Natronorubrum daqingense]|uniref:Uncharacterized protein n=1 Tax=Natronorubrum daqingense TaxID=588898 RepID=A0A1P8RGV7_9EURY|nr:hypothetical protein BB347_15355 [Natronorubrum daqingense]